MNVTTQELAAAVANLEARLGRMPIETELSDELRWTDSQAALIALGQESEAVRPRQGRLPAQVRAAVYLRYGLAEACADGTVAAALGI